MATATAISFGKKILRLEFPKNSGIYVAPCVFDSREFRKIKNTNETIIGDCADDDLPAWVGREIASMDWSVSGEGLLTEESYLMWKTIWLDTASWRVQFETIFPGAVGSQKEEGRAQLVNMGEPAERGQKVKLSFEMQADGALAYV